MPTDAHRFAEVPNPAVAHDVSVICVYNRPETLERFLVAGLERQTLQHERILLDNRCGRYTSCAAALNDGARRARGRLLLFVHQDTELLEPDALAKIVGWAGAIPDLGVAGAVGAIDAPGPVERRSVHTVLFGMPPNDVPTPGTPIDSPRPVQTLDELLLVIPRDVFSARPFDERVCDAWDLYGVDYALSVPADGRRAYVFPVAVLHVSPGRVSDDYYRVLIRLRRKYRHLRAISTTINRWPWWYPLRMYLAVRRLRRQWRG